MDDFVVCPACCGDGFDLVGPEMKQVLCHRCGGEGLVDAIPVRTNASADMFALIVFETIYGPAPF